MGITGLLPLLKSIQKPCNLKKFQGQTIGVDAYGWLHRGTVACATDLALGKITTKYVDFAMHRVRMLIYFGVTPYLVFDGDNLPSKAAVERERAERREESKRRGLGLYHAGRTSQAHQELQKAVDVTPQMARRLIEELKRNDIQYVVAPYEADAQLTYLERKGIINGILSEDSDLLVFGAKRLLTKLDQHGDCVEINRADFTACRDISLIGWTDTDFRCMAILSGCDYLPSINKMGLKTAYRYVRKYKNIEKVLRMLSFDGQFCVPTGYLEKFKQAELTFIHHRVFCPVAQKMVMLTNLRQGMDEDDLPFLGKYVEAETAVGVACGDLDPMSKEVIPTVAQHPVVHGRSFEPRRVTLGSTADLKGSRKPIDAWFKPKRTPLAELDPNSLCYSPGGLRTIEANGEYSYSAGTTSSAPQMRRSTSVLSDSNGTTESMVRNSERVSFLARAAKISTYRSPKRQRLCSDAGEASPTAVRVSPFFSANPEPSRRMSKRKGRKSNGSDFGIHSDDSVEKALMNLPDIDQLPTVSKLQVFGEQPFRREASLESSNHPEGECLASTEVLVPQSSPVQTDRSEDGEEQSSSTEENSQSPANEDSDNTTQTTDATSVSAETDPKAFDDLLSIHTDIVNRRLRANSYCPTPDSQSERTSKEAEMVKIGQAALEDHSTSEMRRQNSLREPDKQQRADIQNAKTVNTDDEGDSQVWQMSSGDPTTSTANNNRTHSFGPSEDLLVPNSEDDGEDQSDPEDGQKSHPLDLGHFAYKPK